MRFPRAAPFLGKSPRPDLPLPLASRLKLVVPAPVDEILAKHAAIFAVEDAGPLPFDDELTKVDRATCRNTNQEVVVLLELEYVSKNVRKAVKFLIALRTVIVINPSQSIA